MVTRTASPPPTNHLVGKPARKHHHCTTKGNGKGRTKIGLEQDQQHRKTDKRSSRDDGPPGADQADRQAVIKPCQNQHDRRFHQFRWLQHHETEVKPALTAPSDGSQRLHQHQQHHHGSIDGKGRQSGQVHREERHHERHGKRHPEAQQV